MLRRKGERVFTFHLPNINLKSIIAFKILRYNIPKFTAAERNTVKSIRLIL